MLHAPFHADFPMSNVSEIRDAVPDRTIMIIIIISHIRLALYGINKMLFLASMAINVQLNRLNKNKNSDLLNLPRRATSSRTSFNSFIWSSLENELNWWRTLLPFFPSEPMASGCFLRLSKTEKHYMHATSDGYIFTFWSRSNATQKSFKISKTRTRMCGLKIRQKTHWGGWKLDCKPVHYLIYNHLNNSRRIKVYREARYIKKHVFSM